MKEARSLSVLGMLLLLCSADLVAQPLPEGEYYGGQTFSPEVELILAGGNALLAGYNGYLLAQNRRRSFPGGLAVITGAISLSIGFREEANYPTLDLALGAAAVLAGAAQMLLNRRFLRQGKRTFIQPALQMQPGVLRDGADARPALRLLFAAR